jgi:hypothetical protein
MTSRTASARAAGARSRSRLARQSEVEEDELRRVARHQPQQRRTVVQLGNAKALALQIAAEENGDLGLVVDDSDVGRGAHGQGR